MPRTPEVTVAAVTETAGRFLIVEERVNRRLLFNQPAGHVEPGESLLAAVVREAREETAWRFEPAALLGVYQWRNPRRGTTMLRFAFTGTVADHDAAQPLDRGIVRTHWLSAADLEAARGPAAQPAGPALRAGLPQRQTGSPRQRCASGSDERGLRPGRDGHHPLSGSAGRARRLR